MAYLTAADIAVLRDPEKVAQLCTPSHLAVVPAELMRLTLTGGARAGYPTDAIDAADAAFATVSAELAATEQLVDGYLAGRYVLPLSPVPGVLKGWVLDIVWFRLLGDRIGKPSEDSAALRYRDALRFLEQVRDGKLSLGASDPVVNDVDSEILIDAPGRSFTQTTLADY
ncbi:DUF1320 domain-containing protein [Ahniella affigens]|uniref:DUF1320 domain-containing protein n=1 Tax=Ahniella affigens TaxID=2021234 RepID=A0A2P1PSS4_9GAMM|nr:DUF1320 domain-containing protein [Ahniella affigens]AVP97905.1 DUF1320 domain-containing protein [Ahniella affigens]